MERNNKYFEERLEKETYSKDEVAKMLHSEADFTTRKTKDEFKDFVPMDKYNELETELSSTKEALAPYKQEEFNKNVGSTLKELNANADRAEDFLKLSGVSMETPLEEVKDKALQMKESGNYEFLFPKTNSAGVRHTEHQQPEQKVAIKNYAPQAGLVDKLFKKYNK